MKHVLFTSIIFLFLSASGVHAQIEITEIMYDAEGTDAGYEWIEITNTSGASVDISQWHFYEADVHHGLYPDGFSSLESGERGLIVQNFDNIYAQYGNNQNLIKSSFSLNNTGETLALSDPEKIITSSIQYSSDDGGAGNGFSLQRSGSSWLEGTPTPGATNISSGEPTTQQNSSNSSGPSSSSSKNKITKTEQPEKEEYYTPFIETTGLFTQHADIVFEAFVTHTRGAKTTKKIKGGSYYLNFGDGFSLNADERIEYTHSYEYPGTYTVVFEFYSNRFDKDAKKPPRAYLEKEIAIVSDSISISSLDSNGNVGITNTSGSKINLEHWTLSALGDSYVFPRHSYIQEGATIVVPSRIHKLEIPRSGGIYLYNSKDVRVSSSRDIEGQNNSNAENNLYSLVSTTPKSESGSTQELSPEKSFNERFLEAHPEKIAIPLAAVNKVPVREQNNQSNRSIPIALPASIMILSFAFAAYKMYQEKSTSSLEEKSIEGIYHKAGSAEIELIEE